ncbi:flagellar hook-basal body complex protein FliE [Thioalkalivibrio sulfidiphilus]|uniref:Flagellar hook-basal body complex protein FliE n=1 Tax=Thioalkalivibrio sulfidiphilus (strain HL-EbGR7) TaxID=396588 RepID=B8GT36_THISH|nr:flagellar hook-basal body complex protein FliE [Thioalkalivibrio sulfidiphilus]ACL73051.1 flagellar hook-basal body protein FliE [Thioalkalivibrio sulfidiphilus HL-EbGr7]
MSDMQINQVLAQMRALAANSGLNATPAQEPSGVNFAQMLKQSLDQVNQTQQAASELRNAFELGDPNVNLAQVMVAMQKSSISFEAVNQVRNRLLNAYQEIMRMPL